MLFRNHQKVTVADILRMCKQLSQLELGWEANRTLN